MAPLHVVISEDHANHKRTALTTFGLVGAFSNREHALKVAILRRIEAMQEHIEHTGSKGSPIAEEVRNFCEECKDDVVDISQGLWEKSEVLTEKLYGDWEDSNGKSSGLRFSVQELPAVDQTIDGDILAEDLDTKWVDEVEGLEAYDPENGSQESGSKGSGDGSEEKDWESEHSDDDFEGLEEMAPDELTLLLKEAAEGEPAERKHKES